MEFRTGALLSAALSAVVTFLVYIPALRNGFVKWDDHLYIYENGLIRTRFNLEFLKRVFFSAQVSNWHPITMISYAVDYRLWGLNPFGYHLENVILHSFNAFLVAILTSRLYSLAKTRRDERGAAFAALVAALLFGLHPQHVESVSWASERKDVLCGFFFILTIIAYLGYAHGNINGRRGVSSYFLSLVFFILALMSKPMAITIPAVLLLLDFYPLRRFERLKPLIAEKIPFFLLAAISAYLTVWAQDRVIVTFKRYPFPMRAANAVRSYMFYLYKTILPFHLAPYYPIPSHPFGPAFIASAGLLAVISGLCVLTIKRSRIFTAAWLYYLITLSPVIGIIQAGGQAAADRYAYLPLLGPFIAVAGAAGHLACRDGRKVLTGAVLGALFISAALSVLTIRQERLWMNQVTLWTREIKEFPDSAMGYDSLGNGYADGGDYTRALESFTAAIRLDPLDARPYNNRGHIYTIQKRYENALADFNAAVRLMPASPIPRTNRGVALLESGMVGEAIEDFKTSIILNPKNGANYYYLGVAYSKLGDAKNAALYFEEADKMRATNNMN